MYASKSALERLSPLSHSHKVPSEGILVSSGALLPTSCLCYALSRGSPDLEFGFGFGVSEARVGMDRASASGSLCQLCFHVWYLAMGGGHITGVMAKQVTGWGG